MSRCTILLLLAALVVVMACLAQAGPTRQKRGFRNAALSTARGFGKRMDDEMHADLSRPLTSNWLADQISRSPALAKLLVERVIDQNGDGLIHPEEMAL